MKLKKFSFVLVGRTVSTGMQGLFYIIFAFILGPESFGNLSYIISLAGVVGVISRFGLNQTVVVHQAKNNLMLVNQINLLAIIMISFGSVILLFIDIFAALLCLAGTFFIMNIHNQLGIKQYKKFFLLNISKGILIIIFPIIFYSFFELYGIIIGMSIGYLFCCFNFFRTIKLNFQFELLRKNFKVILHNFGADTSSRLTQYVDKLMIAPILGFSSLGIYQLNLQILLALEVLPLGLNSFLLSEEASGEKHKKISLLVIASSIIIVISVILLAPYFISVFFSEFVEGVLDLQIIIISLIPLTIASILNAKLQARESTKIGYSAIIRIGILLGLIFVLGSTYGTIGLSFAVLISTITYTIFLFVVYKIENSEN